MSRLKFALPAAALLLLGAMATAPAQAAPATGLREALATLSDTGGGAEQVHWRLRRWHREHHWDHRHWRRHHHHHHHHGDRHHHRRDHHQHHRHHHDHDRHR